MKTSFLITANFYKTIDTKSQITTFDRSAQCAITESKLDADGIAHMIKTVYSVMSQSSQLFDHSVNYDDGNHSIKNAVIQVLKRAFSSDPLKEKYDALILKMFNNETMGKSIGDNNWCFSNHDQVRVTISELPSW